MAEEKFSRLPKEVLPQHYDLTLQTDFDNNSFTGNSATRVTFSGDQPITSITLNAVEIEIQKAALKVGEKTLAISKDNIQFNADQEIVKLNLPAPIDPSQTTSGTLEISFSGILNDKMKGFYRSSYTVEGKKKTMACTQFESTDARRAFPCWDEPALKATFNTTLIVPPREGYSFTVLSNTPCTRTFVNDEKNSVHVFEKTPIMSTYLLAFIVGEFDFVEKSTDKGQTIRVYTPKGKKDQGVFALDVAVRALPFYEKFFGIDYPLNKCDLIAVPDFAAGAMENWGCITYRETALLIDPNSSSASTKQWVAIVVSHELAHQWFGNLVTMEWWTHLWLNEGFASFCEYLCVDNLFPEWKVWEQFVGSDMSHAFSLDALKSSHPVEVEVNSPAEVDEIFDAVSYSKGGSIIRMLESVLGQENFMKGLNYYLNKHTYKNTFTEDLWEGLSKFSEIPVKKMMDSFTKQTGYPVLFVKRENNNFEIEQYRFLKSGVDRSDPTLWQVPLTWKPIDETKVETKLFGERTVQIPAPQKPVIFNPHRTGFYRICYEASLLKELRGPLEQLVLHPIDRLSIQTDSFALAQCGLLDTVSVLELFESYKNENNYTVWSDLNGNLSAMSSVFSQQAFAPQFKAWGAQLVKPLASKLGWNSTENESHLDSLLRTLVLGRLVAFGDSDTLAEAQTLFKKFLVDNSTLSPNLRSLVYRAVISQADQKVFDSVIELFKNFEMHEEKERVMRVLGWAPTEDLLKQVLEFSLSEHVRSQDAVFCIETVAFNPKGSLLAWKFLQDNWDKLFQMYEGGFLLSRLVKSCCSVFTKREMTTEIKDFFQKHPAPAVARSIDQSIESIQANAAWIERDGSAIEKFFESRK